MRAAHLRPTFAVEHGFIQQVELRAGKALFRFRIQKSYESAIATLCKRVSCIYLCVFSVVVKKVKGLASAWVFK